MRPGDVIPLLLQNDLVALSFFIALLGAYVALSAAARIKLNVLYGDDWAGFAVLGAFAMGGVAIWGMHFMGMRAQKLPFLVTYSFAPTVVSAIVAIGFSGAAFFYLGGRPFSLWRCLVAGVSVGLAAAAMHYIGISAMLMPAVFRWNSSLVVLSVMIAVLAATVSIWLAFNMQREWQRLGAAAVMAIAICGMHYTGAAAGVIVCTSSLAERGEGQINWGVSPYVAFVIVVLILTAMRWQLYRSYKKYQLRIAQRF